MGDIKIDTTGDLAYQNGDFSIETHQKQSALIVLYSMRGDFKNNIYIGADLIKLIATEDADKIFEIRKALKFDEINPSKIDIENNQINLIL
ncbi:MAG: hypothetical protein ACK4EX_02475 [Thermaurantimonas sp.]|uniref:Uncharacterized protein n=1 Tax=Thermaurantimonas aggregans TaxID=2173829 RepID=A0A401XI18_9FLAO|nr:hypothetical protein [Thermaurantimonas aggregans]MCX8149209.1 hypothetical protein [Thermaurantimonas aggregans]GCD76651.1 hypothetical protein JCM31826_01330 [Thermaurantimonas aggregans]